MAPPDLLDYISWHIYEAHMSLDFSISSFILTKFNSCVNISEGMALYLSKSMYGSVPGWEYGSEPELKYSSVLKVVRVLYQGESMVVYRGWEYGSISKERLFQYQNESMVLYLSGRMFLYFCERMIVCIILYLSESMVQCRGCEWGLA